MRKLPEIPELLSEKAKAYECMRDRKLADWPPYMQMYGWLEDKKLTFEDIAGRCGVGRERIRQVCDEFFPGVRPKEVRRLRCGRNTARRRAARRRARLKRIVRQYKHSSPIYTRLVEHSKNASFELAWVAKDNGEPAYRSVIIDGEKACVMYVKKATKVNGTSWYAHCIGPVKATLKSHVQMLVVLDLYIGTVRYRRLYKNTTEAFIRANLAYVLIRLNGPYGNGGTKAAICWDEHLISEIS